MNADFEKIGAAFDVSANAARDFFQGGDSDPEGLEKIQLTIAVHDPVLYDYSGRQFVQRLLIACIKCGVPTDQLLAIEWMCYNN